MTHVNGYALSTWFTENTQLFVVNDWLLTVSELESLGYAAVLFPVTLLRLAMHAVDQGLEQLQQYGTQSQLLSKMQTRQSLYDLLGYTEFEQRDRKYFGESE